MARSCFYPSNSIEVTDPDGLEMLPESYNPEVGNQIRIIYEINTASPNGKRYFQADILTVTDSVTNVFEVEGDGRTVIEVVPVSKLGDEFECYIPLFCLYEKNSIYRCFTVLDDSKQVTSYVGHNSVVSAELFGGSPLVEPVISDAQEV